MLGRKSLDIIYPEITSLTLVLASHIEVTNKAAGLALRPGNGPLGRLAQRVWCVLAAAKTTMSRASHRDAIISPVYSVGVEDVYFISSFFLGGAGR